MTSKVVTTAQLELVPPEGGRIHIVSRVPVNLAREWQVAINAAGPNTPSNYCVREVADQYPPTGNGTAEETEVILMNFGPKRGSWDRAIAWSKKYHLKRTGPRHVFAIGEHEPGLNRKLGMSPMHVVVTRGCAFEGHRHACFVWWLGFWRKCDLRRVWYFVHSLAWFAFLRE